MVAAHLLKTLKPYRFLIILISAILLGGLSGHLLGPKALSLKPLGDIFLNLLFSVVTPLVFFSVASAIAGIGELKRLWNLISSMLGVFLFTGVSAAVFMLLIVKLFPPGQGVLLSLNMPVKVQAISLGEQIVNIFTVTDFIKLFSRDNMLALIFFAVLIGLATLTSGAKAKPFAALLQSGAEISMKAVAFIMYYAPVGFFAYFAVLVGELGPKLLTTYFRATLIYYPAALCYFILAFTGYAYLAGKKTGVKLFWQNAALPSLTALATCSSAASIPANLQAARNMRAPSAVYETVVPLGAIIHKDGSVLGGMLKIAFLFGVFHLSFSGAAVLLPAVLISLLVGTVMGAIPSGGMVGEMLILSIYGFPPQALIVIAAISMLIDPPATMLNVVSNSVCSMLVARLTAGKNWFKNKQADK